jgi:K+-transporting ATPase ATPase C chain
MMSLLRPALALITLFTLLTGILLPLGFTGAASVVVPGLANGSLIERNGKVVGSALIGQNFAGARYFHPRPSATTDTDPKDATKTIAAPYNAANSTGSNLGPTSKALLDRIKADASGGKNIPGDMLTTSASGLDPDISPENAALQVARVAAARGVKVERVRAILSAHTSGRLLGFIGEPRVNVLAVNLALDEGT